MSTRTIAMNMGIEVYLIGKMWRYASLMWAQFPLTAEYAEEMMKRMTATFESLKELFPTHCRFGGQRISMYDVVVIKGELVNAHLTFPNPMPAFLRARDLNMLGQWMVARAHDGAPKDWDIAPSLARIKEELVSLGWVEEIQN
jgi:hypothetical protein